MGDISQWIKEYQETKDEQILWNIIQRFEPAIRKAVYHVNKNLRDDMRQELMIAVWHAVEKLGDCSSEGGCVKYISSTIHNQARHIYSIAKKQEEHEQTVDAFWDESAQTTVSDYSMAEFQADLEAKTRNMNHVQKRMAEYAFLQGISDAQIAQQLQISRQYLEMFLKSL